MRRRRTTSLLLWTLSAALVTDVALSQRPASQDPRQNKQDEQTQRPSLLGPNPVDLLKPRLPPGFRGVNRSLPIFQGFPTFPPQVPGFGGYPGGALPVPFTGLTVAPTAPGPTPLPNSWPSWFGGEVGDRIDGFTADIGLLNQLAERVWYRGDAVHAYLPLRFYDKFRVLQVGAEIEVRHGGVYQLTFHKGASVRSDGPSKLRLIELEDESIELEFETLSRLWLTVRERPMTVRFQPSGLVVDSKLATLELERTAGIVVVKNHGPSAARLGYGSEQVEIPPSHHVRFLALSAAQSATDPALRTEGDVVTARDGRSLRATAGALGGAVDWSGARFRIGGGATLRIDALAGDEFPAYRKRLPVRTK